MTAPAIIPSLIRKETRRARVPCKAFVDVDDDGYATALASAALGRAEFERFITDVKQRAVVC